MSHGAGKGGKKRGGHEEEHENHERWAVSYADMMTVLMALFLVLFAMSNIDVKKFEELRTSLAKGFGNEALPADGGSGINSGGTPNPVDMPQQASPQILDQSSATSANNSSTSNGEQNAAGFSVGTDASTQLAAQAEAAHLKAMQDQVDQALAAKGLSGIVQTSIDGRGLNIDVVANDIFFANASAAIQPRGLAVLDAVGPVLAGGTENISVEGHANNLKINSPLYPTNWELSGARAISVTRHLGEADGVPGARLQAIALGDAHPLFPDDDPRAVEGNRRVDIVVESKASAAVRALIPSYLGGGSSGASSAGVVPTDIAPAGASTSTTPGTP